MVKQVTQRAAVEAAMDEFDRLGREAFLAKYRFGPALRYFVMRNGKRYDSKAIYGVAHQNQFPDDGEVASAEFSGGEHMVQRPLEALGFEFEIAPAGELPDSNPVPAGSLEIRSEDVSLIAGSRIQEDYREIPREARDAYVRIANSLKTLGDALRLSLTRPDEFEVRTTSGFHLQSGVRGRHPKDLWFSVSPKSNAKTLAAMPQAFMIVSPQGVEYGYGASVHPSDLSHKDAKEAIRQAAPIVFDNLPHPGSIEASKLEAEIEASGDWYFRRKHRLPPNGRDFPNLESWLSFLKSAEGAQKAAGGISRYVSIDEIDAHDFVESMRETARLFDPLLDREWKVDDETNATAAELALDFSDDRNIGSKVTLSDVSAYGSK